MYPGTLLITLDRAGISETLGDINSSLTNRSQQIKEYQLALSVAERMAEPLETRWRELRALAESIRTLSDGIDFLTRIRLERELSDARLAWEKNHAELEKLPQLIAELNRERAQLLRRRNEVLTSWQNYQVVSNDRGTVGSRVISEGGVVTPGDVMLRILDREKKTILWELPRNILRLPRIGERVRIKLASGTLEGVVDRILPLSASPAVGRGSANQLVEVAIIDQPAALPLESSVTVRMHYFW